MSLHLEREDFFDKFDLCLRKFNRARNQMDLLDWRIKDTKIRCDRAVKNRNNRFRYTLQQRLKVLTGVKTMYYMYASKMADEMDEMNQGMLGYLPAERIRTIYMAAANRNSEAAVNAGMLPDNAADQVSSEETDSDDEEEASIL